MKHSQLNPPIEGREGGWGREGGGGEGRKLDGQGREGREGYHALRASHESVEVAESRNKYEAVS